MTLRSTVTTLLAAAVLVLGWNAVTARADGEGDVATRLKAAEGDAQLLRAEVDYLLVREASLSKYVLALRTAAQGVTSMTGQARAQGFEAAAIPQESRSTVLHGLDTLARDLSTGLPEPTKAEAMLKERAAALRRELGK